MVIVLLVLLIVVVLAGIALGLPLLDRLCAATAERRSSEALAVPFGRPATVRIDGAPFLTQALRGRYDSVRVSGAGLQLGEITGATLDARLRGAHVPLRDVVHRRIGEIPCEQVEGELVLPFGELARVTGIPGLELHLSGDRLMASAALPVPGINQLARVSGEAVLTLAEGNTVRLRVRGVSVAGFTLPGLVLSQLLPSLNVPIPLPQLPYGLRMDELRPTPAGLVVSASAEAVVFRAMGARTGSGSGTPPARPRPTAPPGPTRRDERPEV